MWTFQEFMLPVSEPLLVWGDLHVYREVLISRGNAAMDKLTKYGCISIENFIQGMPEEDSDSIMPSNYNLKVPSRSGWFFRFGFVRGGDIGFVLALLFAK